MGIGNVLTSIFAGFVIFPIIGYLAKELGKDVDKVVEQGELVYLWKIIVAWLCTMLFKGHHLQNCISPQICSCGDIGEIPMHSLSHYFCFLFKKKYCASCFVLLDKADDAFGETPSMVLKQNDDVAQSS